MSRDTSSRFWVQKSVALNRIVLDQGKNFAITFVIQTSEAMEFKGSKIAGKSRGQFTKIIE